LDLDASNLVDCFLVVGRAILEMCKRFILTIGAKQGRGFLHDGAEGTKAPASSLEIKKSAQIKFLSLSSSLRIILGEEKGA
jgi:hypothetical protein